MNPPHADKQASWLALFLVTNKITRKGHMWIMCQGWDSTTPRPLTMTAVEPSPSTTLDHTWPQLERWQKWMQGNSKAVIFTLEILFFKIRNDTTIVFVLYQGMIAFFFVENLRFESWQLHPSYPLPAKHLSPAGHTVHGWNMLNPAPVDRLFKPVIPDI